MTALEVEIFCQHKSRVPEAGAPTPAAPSNVSSPGNQHFPKPGSGDDGAQRGAPPLTRALGDVQVYFCEAGTFLKPGVTAGVVLRFTPSVPQRGRE